MKLTDLRPRLRGSARPVGSLAAVAAATLALVGPGPSAAGLGYSPGVDQPSPYEPQVTCTTRPQPGTVALSRWLLRHYPATGSLGLMRACSDGGTSEHKDGRAFDWAADVGRRRTRRAAYDFIHRLLATDAAGNPDALARRLGIMYFIYNDHIWSSYRDFVPRPYLNSACADLQHCSRTLRHLNHVHISLGYAGAAAQTSWYRARNVPSTPVLFPGTDELNPDETAVTALRVPADGRTASSSFLLRAGITYRIVVTGTVPYAGGGTADADCTPSAGGPVPTVRGILTDPLTGLGLGSGLPRLGDWGGPGGSLGSTHPASPYAAPLAETTGLLLHGALRWETTGGDPTGCATDHTYEAWYTPPTSQRLQLRYASPTPGSGSFTAYVARDDILTSSLAGH